MMSGGKSMKKGIVKWFSNEKGYGFITDEVTGVDVFVHFTGILSDGYKSLEEGQRVVYEEARGTHGLQATQVVIYKEDHD